MNSETQRDSSVNSKTHKETYSPRIPFLLGRGGSITILDEGVSPIDSMTMVSNAFTSNSFDASGSNIFGKINSLVLAWSGFILSGVGTATLAASIVNRYVTRQFDELKELVKKKKEDN